MSTRKSLVASALAILLLLLVMGPAVAERRDGPPIELSSFVQRTPEARAEGWRDGLVKFMAEHPELTGEQAYAIQKLAEIESPAAFAYTLASHRRDLFAERLAEVGSVLSYRDYLELLRSFAPELRVWLVRNSLAPSSTADSLICNCTIGGAGCAAGVSCDNVICIHQNGTTHNGSCSGSVEQQ